MRYNKFENRIEDIEDDVQKIFKAYSEIGKEIYMVGGRIRDAVLGYYCGSGDIDFCTNALPSDIYRVADIIGEKEVAVIPTGERFGTMCLYFYKKEQKYEITTYRIDGRCTDKRHPQEVIFGDSLIKDLSRRDFTMNAIACDSIGNLVDPFGGLQDIKNGKIRCVGNPSERFEEDALRILRLIRFALKTEFDIDNDTLNAALCNATNVNKISKERIGTELRYMRWVATGKNEDCRSLLKAVFTALDEVNKDKIEEVFEWEHSFIAVCAKLFEKLTIRETIKVLNRFAFGNQTINDIIGVVKGSKFLYDPLICGKALSYCSSIVNQYDVVYMTNNEVIRSILMEYISKDYPVSISDLKINGDIICEVCKIKPGQKVKEILNYLLDIVIADPTANTLPNLMNRAVTYVLCGGEL